MIDRDDRLWLLVSRRCDLRCGFCPVEFTGEDMPLDVAQRAIAAYRRHLPAGAVPTVKFFGGEPLLNWPVMRATIEEARDGGAGLAFEVTTNGTYLDREKIEYLKERPEVEVTLSFRAEDGASLPGVWFSVILTQGRKAEDVIAQMRTLLTEGYRRFNIKPAYVTLWSEEELRELERTFAALARLFSGLRGRGVEYRLKNTEITAPFPLYNASLTVDTDGTVYSSSLIESRGARAFQDYLRVGTVESWPAPGDPRRTGRFLGGLIRRWAGPEVWDSTQKADAAMTRFVEAVPPSRELLAAA